VEVSGLPEKESGQGRGLQVRVADHLFVLIAFTCQVFLRTSFSSAHVDCRSPFLWRIVHSETPGLRACLPSVSGFLIIV
jgi:hypothetical protein